MSFNSERSYEVRITRVYGGPQGPQDTIFYDYAAVDTMDGLKGVRAAPFRRWVFATTEQPLINAAMEGDRAIVSICHGEARLTDVPEQYLAGPCDQPTP